MNNLGQFNYPSFDKFEEMAKGIFERQYYTNHGPLAKEFEHQLEFFFDVRNAVTMSNSSIAIMISVKALGLKGKIIVPNFGESLVFNSIIWSGLEPVYCEVDTNLQLKIDSLFSVDLEGVSAILAIHNFGDAVDINFLENFSNKNKLKLIFISSDAFGQKYDQIRFGNFGDLEIFSFNEKHIINAANGAVVTTNNNLLAEKLRNIRSSYGTRESVDIPFTGNGRLSEIQAGMGLLSLADFTNNVLFNSIFKDNLIKKIKLKTETFELFSISNSHISEFVNQQMLLCIKEVNVKNEISSLFEITNNIHNYLLNPVDKKKVNLNTNKLFSSLIEIPVNKRFFEDYLSF
jgi:dTDP-4-amino-4,6-dideoxygalactose transaminase